MIAAVLEENRLKSSRVQANLVVELIEARRRTVPPVSGSCARCGQWEAAVGDVSIRRQTVDVAVSMGREVPLIWWLFGELDRAPRRVS